METLFAPWRMVYIEHIPSESGCFMCDLASQEPSPQNLVIAKTSSFLAVMNRFPYNPAHILIAPLRHIDSPTKMTEREMSSFYRAQNAALSFLQDLMSPHGFNVGINLGAAGGAGLPSHLHLHIVPRWVGDANFMPILGDTKVIPEAMEATYQRLLPLGEILQGLD